MLSVREAGCAAGQGCGLSRPSSAVTPTAVLCVAVGGGPVWVWARLGLLVGAGGLGCEGSSRLHSPRPRVVRDAGGTIAQSHAASGALARPDRVGPAVGSIGWAAGAAGAQVADSSAHGRVFSSSLPSLCRPCAEGPVARTAVVREAKLALSHPSPSWVPGGVSGCELGSG